MAHYEPLFYGAQVDLVLSGHVHSYERSLPLFNYSVDPCGPAYIVVGGLRRPCAAHAAHAARAGLR